MQIGIKSCHSKDKSCYRESLSPGTAIGLFALHMIEIIPGAECLR